MRASSLWPVGVKTQEDMHRYAKTSFANCEIEDLLSGTPFDGNPGCFLIRVKGACSTMDGLRLLHPEQIRKLVQAGMALNDVWRRFKRAGVLRDSDHPGAIGAALCFLKRKKKKSGDGSRMGMN